MADRIRRIAPAAVALPVLFLVMSGMARANTITVTSLSDIGATSICILRDAITAANSMTATNGCAAGSGTDSIVFEPGLTGTITLESTLPTITDSNLTITGPTGAPGITISGGGNVQVMEVGGGATLLQNLTIADGSFPGGNGGGIENTSTLTVTNCTFFDNRTSDENGGGIYNSGTLMVTNSTFSGNSVLAGEGGGIENVGTLTVTNSTFSGNSAHGGGGGIENFGGTLTVTNSTFSGNTANEGGGIDNDGALTVTNSTFSGNGVGDVGGGIANFDKLTVTNSTFSGNSAGTGGGGIRNGATATLKGTILAAEPDGGNCDGPIGDADYNISDDASCDFTEAPSGKSINGSTTLNLDPAGLQNNGGPTQTIALEDDSEAVHFIPVLDCTDQESPPMQLTTDQRGFPRPDPGNPNFCDAGAFELQTTPIVISASGERLQIVHSSTPSGNLLNTSFTFTELGFPACDAGDDPFNGIDVAIEPGSCAASGPDAIGFFLNSWAVQTVNHQIYGTLSSIDPPENLTVRMVELPTPAAPACGEWTINIEFTGVDLTPLGDGPFALILRNPDGDAGCFDITNAIVGNQIDPPTRTVRRGVRK
jgi:hypothetical protein